MHIGRTPGRGGERVDYGGGHYRARAAAEGCLCAVGSPALSLSLSRCSGCVANMGLHPLLTYTPRRCTSRGDGVGGGGRQACCRRKWMITRLASGGRKGNLVILGRVRVLPSSLVGRRGF